jgi:exopolyphosphatase/guanosine-5'-triphosphate,3'-diphosphate pyrophosphatase
MRLAVIDCGTNTFNLIIIELSGEKKYSKVYKTRIPVKLGEGAINEGFIADASFNRGVEAIRVFSETIKEHSVNKTLAFATSAIRDATNGKEFTEKIKSAFGIDITVIDGNREAELIYFGIREAVKLSHDVSLIIDIGGGSTEFIIASQQELFWKQSFRLGAARLLERFKPSDPITASEIQSMNDYLTQELADLFEAVKKFQPKELIGSSGAFDSLVEMIHGEMGGEPLEDFKTEYEIDLTKYKHITELVKKSTLQQRRDIKGLVPMRLDMIVISCVMVDFILKALHLNKLRVSIYSLKEGALVDFINHQS